ncbi:MAG: hypothetical protein IKB97_00840 [Bacteroidaceae bacterium]|nr:hypothetical protein [Bacteroidaceae bacterium]
MNPSPLSSITTLLRRYPLTLCCIVLIWVLCFCTPPSTGLNNVIGIDKVAHVLMYFGSCGIFWMELLRHRSAKDNTEVNPSKSDYWSVALGSFAAFTAMSGLVELLQEFATPHRSGEWFDLLANASGAALASCFGALFAMKKCSRQG